LPDSIDLYNQLHQKNQLQSMVQKLFKIILR
jgi:hypothetical protein